jgi:hypothetical protein
MRLIDELLAPMTCAAWRAPVRATQLFVDDAGMPAWIGIEYMAQTVAAWAGMQARGTAWAGRRRVPARLAALCLRRAGVSGGQRADHPRAAGDGGRRRPVAVRLHAGQDGAEVARATVSVYRPADARAFLEGQQT